VIPGVEGLVHISELAPHHVENPREVVQQGETLRAKIIEMDADRRRLSLSLKRVEEGESARPGIGEDAPELGLSDEVFTEQAAPEPEAEAVEVDVEAEPAAGAEDELLVADEATVVEAEPEAEEPAETVTDEAPVEDEAAPEGEASAEPDEREQ
jgi:small subunit ribosomal protein S1